MCFKTELPPPPVEILKYTTCEVHIIKRQQIHPRDLDSFDAYEKEKNCCTDCEKKRVELWGRPTDQDIQQIALKYRDWQKTDLKLYNALIEEANLFSMARDNNDIESLDKMTWSQFDGCEREDKPFWISEDYKKLLIQIEGN